MAAHEWAHLAGYADESEASFVGWLTCVRADEAAQYSAWLFLYWEIEQRRAARPSARRSPPPSRAGPRADIAAVVDRVRRGQLPRLRAHQLGGLRPVPEGQPRRGGRAQLRRGHHAAGAGAVRRTTGCRCCATRQPLAAGHQPLSRSGPRGPRPRAGGDRRSPRPSPSSAGSARARISSTPAASSSRSAA